MTREEKWRKLFESRGWIHDDIVRCGDDGTLKITIVAGHGSPEHHSVTTESAMILPESEMLCCEDKKGTLFFHWEDIVAVRLEPAAKSKGWL